MVRRIKFALLAIAVVAAGFAFIPGGGAAKPLTAHASGCYTQAGYDAKFGWSSYNAGSGRDDVGVWLFHVYDTCGNAYYEEYVYDYRDAPGTGANYAAGADMAIRVWVGGVQQTGVSQEGIPGNSDGRSFTIVSYWYHYGSYGPQADNYNPAWNGFFPDGIAVFDDPSGIGHYAYLPYLNY